MHTRTSTTTVRLLALTAAVVFQFSATTNTAWALGSTPVRVVNPETDPALTRDVDRPANSPYSKELCVTDISGACNASATRPAQPSTFVVPSLTSSGETVKQLVIEFVSGICVGTARTTTVELASRPVGSLANPATGDNFSTNRIPMSVAQFLQGGGINGVQGFAQATKIYLAPNSSVSVNFDRVAAGLMVCRTQLNGYLALD